MHARNLKIGEPLVSWESQIYKKLFQYSVINTGTKAQRTMV